MCSDPAVPSAKRLTASSLLFLVLVLAKPQAAPTTICPTMVLDYCQTALLEHVMTPLLPDATTLAPTTAAVPSQIITFPMADLQPSTAITMPPTATIRMATRRCIVTIDFSIKVHLSGFVASADFLQVACFPYTSLHGVVSLAQIRF